tara:strand:+ start:2240 stop:2410 length:171 start_codon:yes stop_codon:yes gene_type:complete
MLEEMIAALTSLLIVTAINFVVVMTVTIGILYAIDKRKERKEREKKEEQFAGVAKR